jgi:hypothetical protein
MLWAARMRLDASSGDGLRCNSGKHPTVRQAATRPIVPRCVRL